MTSVGRRAIPSERDLARLLQIGVLVEEYAEEKSARLLSEEVGDDEVRDELRESREESAEHRDRLVALVEGVGADVDEDRVESLVRDAVEREIDAPEDPEDALSEQLKSERLAYSFYDDLIDAVKASDWADTEGYDDLLTELADIRQDELEDARKIERQLEEK